MSSEANGQRKGMGLREMLETLRAHDRFKDLFAVSSPEEMAAADERVWHLGHQCMELERRLERARQPAVQEALLLLTEEAREDVSRTPPRVEALEALEKLKKAYEAAQQELEEAQGARQVLLTRQETAITLASLLEDGSLVLEYLESVEREGQQS